MAAMQARLDISNIPFVRSGSPYSKEAETIKQDAGRSAALATYTIMGKRRFSLATTGTADAGNTGDGTVTAVAKLADGKNLIIGDYNLEVTAAGVDGRAAGSVTADAGNTGDGTVTSLAIQSGKYPKVGNWILTCVGEIEGDTISVAAAVADGGNTGNGTVTEQAASTTGAPAVQGTWTLDCIEAIANSGRFRLTNPDGVEVANDILIPAGAGNNIVWDGAGITFKITDGGVDFVVGDFWTIAVSGAHGGKFELADPEGTIVENDIRLPGGAGGSVNVSAGGISFTITDGATDFAEDDFFTLVVSTAQGGVLKLEDPHGNLIASGLTMSGVAGGATTFNVGGMTFTVTDGATDFAIGDKFAITVSADGDYVPLVIDDLLGGAEFAGIYMGDSITAAAIVAGDVSNCPMLVGGRCSVDENQLVLENSLTLSTVLPSGKTIREEMEDAGIYVEATIDIDEYENT